MGFMASEEMLFDNIDDSRMTDACLYYKLTYEPLAQAKNHSKTTVDENKE